MPVDTNVRTTFASISGKYDRMNRLLSLFMDDAWRRHMLAMLPHTGAILDVGCGTGRLEYLLLKDERWRVIGVDLTAEMLRLNEHAEGGLVQGSATLLPFRDNSFAGLMSAFVLRNLPSTHDFFAEAWRVTRKGGHLLTLDILPTRGRITGIPFELYFYRMAPFMADRISGTTAYSYLARSVQGFKYIDELLLEISAAGFEQNSIKSFRGTHVFLIDSKKA